MLTVTSEMAVNACKTLFISIKINFGACWTAKGQNNEACQWSQLHYKSQVVTANNFLHDKMNIGSWFLRDIKVI